VTIDCAFCGQVAGDPDRNEIAALVDESWALRPTLAELGAAVAMPSIGALVPGHTLVCPGEHYRSVLAAPQDVASDVEELTRVVRHRLEAVTGLPTHVFEHGSPRDGSRVACSVEHAHVHVLPTELDVRAQVRAVASWQSTDHDLDTLRALVGDREYLIYEAPTGERLLATTSSGLPSQLLRQVFAAALDIADWNWRTDPAVERIRATAELLSATVLA
jgi:ATP adenylyltransferase